MTRSIPASHAVLAAPDYERLDLRCRDIVNHGISVQESSNTVAAIEYLKAHDIDPTVIERVLLEPQRRRRNIHH
jgi:hypothetical protein